MTGEVLIPEGLRDEDGAVEEVEGIGGCGGEKIAAEEEEGSPSGSGRSKVVDLRFLRRSGPNEDYSKSRL